jgi:hypothetical protein
MSCLDETTSQALDVRLMKVGEALRMRANRIMGTDNPLSGIVMRDAAREVEDIAASIRAAMPDPRAGGAPAPPTAQPAAPFAYRMCAPTLMRQGVRAGLFTPWVYRDGTVSFAEATAPGFFDSARSSFAIGDTITIIARDGTGIVFVSENNARRVVVRGLIQAKSPQIGAQPSPPPPETTAKAIREIIQSATTEQALDEAWSDVAPTLPSLTLVERVSAVEAFITTLCRVSRDDGR